MTQPGYGTINNPMDLATALLYAFIDPGDTIYLRAGTYTGNFTCALDGTSDNHITIKPYNNERVIIDGAFTFGGSYVDIYDIEFTYSGWTTRTSAQSGGTPTDIPYSKTFSGPGTNNSLINCTLYDNAGNGMSDGFAPGKIYGNLIYNYGWLGTDQGHGHALYAQNTSAVNRLEIKHNVIGKGFGYGIHCYATATATIGIDVVANVLGQSTHLVGSENADNSLTATGNHMRGGVFRFGWSTDENDTASMENNYFYDPTDTVVVFERWATPTFQNNTVISGAVGTAKDFVSFVRSASPVTETWNTNTYHNLGSDATPFIDSNTHKSLATWRTDRGFDALSTEAATAPADSVVVFANEYAASSRRKGMFAVWNWSGATSVSVDLTSLSLSVGTSYILRQTLNPLVDTVTFTYSVATISVDMQAASHSVAVPVGHSVALATNTFPTFGCFIVELG